MKPRITVARADAPPPRRRSRAVAVAALAALIVVWLGFEVALYPWAYPLPGQPRLVGVWQAELTTASGRRHVLLLDLDAYLGRCQRCSRLEGVARLCDAHGMREYEGDGNPADWRGTRFSIALHATDDRPDGLRIVKIDAGRDGAALRGHASFESGGPATVAIDRSGNVSRPGAHPDTLAPAPLLLREGSDAAFRDACRRIGAGAQ